MEQKRGVTWVNSDSQETKKDRMQLLHKNLELCRKYKEDAVRYTNRIKSQYDKRILSYTEYEYLLNKYLKGQSLDYWLQHYDDTAKLIREKIDVLKKQKAKPFLEQRVVHIERKPKRNLVAYGITFLLLLVAVFSIPLMSDGFGLSNAITGFTVGSGDYISAYSPETLDPIKVGESQTFTIKLSVSENVSASVQWYVNELPMFATDHGNFEFTPDKPGNYEVKVLVNTLEDYSTHKWALVAEGSGIGILPEEPSPEEQIAAPEENLTVPEENVTPPGQTPIIEENITTPGPTEIIENETLPAEGNLTAPEENLTAPIIEEPDDFLEQMPAEINKPVTWIRAVKNKNLGSVMKVSIPKEAVNIKATKITVLATGEVEEEVSPEKLSINGVSLSKTYMITGMALMEPPKRRSLVLNFFKNLFKVTGFATLSPELQTNELAINEPAPKYRISYETPPPFVEETYTETGKRVRVYSDYHYTEILTYTTINETRGLVELYWLVSDTEALHPADLIDTNDDQVVDRVQWVTPHLSEQIFEVRVTELSDLLNKTLPMSNFTNFVPAAEVYETQNCHECADYNPATVYMCVRTNSKSGLHDYGAEITFEIPPNLSLSYAELCAYQFRIFYDTPLHDDAVLDSYITPVDLTLHEKASKNKPEKFSVSEIKHDSSMMAITNTAGWVCSDVTFMLNAAMLANEEVLRVRLLGPNLKGKSNLPYVCFRGPSTGLSECGDINPSGVDDCRPYLRIIEDDEEKKGKKSER